MVRKFKLLNEKGQEYNFMDAEKSCLLIDPNGLGYEYESEYLNIGSTFVENFRYLQKGKFYATLVSKYYDNISDFINFVEQSYSLKLAYTVPFEKKKPETYYKDVDISTFEKTEKNTYGMLLCPITFDFKSLWYEENKTIYTIESQQEEIRWDFKWDSRFADYNTRSLQYINNGHVAAPIEVTINGHILNPKLELFVEGELYQTVIINVEINEYEKFLYGTRENKFHIDKMKTDGSIESLFSLDYINFENDNVIRMPKNSSCELRLKSQDAEILNAEVTIFPMYKVV